MEYQAHTTIEWERLGKTAEGKALSLSVAFTVSHDMDIPYGKQYTVSIEGLPIGQVQQDAGEVDWWLCEGLRTRYGVCCLSLPSRHMSARAMREQVSAIERGRALQSNH